MNFYAAVNYRLFVGSTRGGHTSRRIIDAKDPSVGGFSSQLGYGSSAAAADIQNRVVLFNGYKAEAPISQTRMASSYLPKKEPAQPAARCATLINQVDDDRHRHH